MDKRNLIKSTLGIFICLLLVFCQSCTDKTNNIEKEPEIIREVLENKDGQEKIKYTTVGAEMPHGNLERLQGQNINSQSLLGKYLVINLWATWCSPCLTDTPAFQNAAKDYPDAEFISVSIDREKSDWKTFLQEEKWSGNHYWIGMDDTNPFYSFAYRNINSDDINGVHVSLPKYVIVSPEGNIIKASFPGPGTPLFKQELDKHIQ